MAFIFRRKPLIILNGGLLLVASGLLLLAFTHQSGYDRACSQTAKTYAVDIVDDQFSKTLIKLQRCDTVQVANRSKQPVELAIGKHERHLVYPGFTEKSLPPDASLTFVARKVGTYTMHDHLRDRAQITLSIAER